MYPLEFISIVPPRIAEAESRLSLDQLRARFARNDGLPFAEVLTGPRIRAALDEHGVRYRDRVFDPVTTLWGFLAQVLSDDPSCRDAVTRIIAHRAASGLETCYRSRGTHGCFNHYRHDSAEIRVAPSGPDRADASAVGCQ
jgi:hypothetical protein